MQPHRRYANKEGRAKQVVTCGGRLSFIDECGSWLQCPRLLLHGFCVACVNCS